MLQETDKASIFSELFEVNWKWRRVQNDKSILLLCIMKCSKVHSHSFQYFATSKRWQDLTRLRTPKLSSLDQMFGIIYSIFYMSHLVIWLFVFVQDSDDEMPELETPGAAGAASSAVVEEEVFLCKKKFLTSNWFFMVIFRRKGLLEGRRRLAKLYWNWVWSKFPMLSV